MSVKNPKKQNQHYWFFPFLLLIFTFFQWVLSPCRVVLSIHSLLFFYYCFLHHYRLHDHFHHNIFLFLDVFLKHDWKHLFEANDAYHTQRNGEVKSLPTQPQCWYVCDVAMQVIEDVGFVNVVFCKATRNYKRKYKEKKRNQ